MWSSRVDSHVAIGVDGAVFLNILHLGWVNMLNLLNSLGLEQIKCKNHKLIIQFIQFAKSTEKYRHA